MDELENEPEILATPRHSMKKSLEEESFNSMDEKDEIEKELEVQAEPGRSLSKSLEEESFNSIDEPEKEPKVLKDDTELSNGKKSKKIDLKSRDIDPNTILADKQGCIDQNIHTEVINFMRDMSSFNIRVYDDTTNDILSRKSELADRLESEKMFFLSTINACTSIEGLSIGSCINLALEQVKPKFYILLSDQIISGRNLYNEKKTEWTKNSLDLMSIYGKFFNAIQQQNIDCV
ncbi:unnamed protein product [Diamesa tonsa]